MKKLLTRHWSCLLTGPLLAALLIIFWFFNQSYLASGRDLVVRSLENPFLTFGLIILGAHIGASLSGEFSVKLPLTFEPLVMALAGGLIIGVGAEIARMSVHSVVLFNLAGVFTLPAFMITKGWIYGVFMVLGGLVASRLFIFLASKTAGVKREIRIPEILISGKNHRIVFYVLLGLYLIATLVVMLLPQFALSERAGLVLAMVLLVAFGLITERGTVCMSSMLKEWFISKSAYVWRSVLFTIMCLALFYQVGFKLSLYEPIVLESYVPAPGLLVAGSFLMGFGFIFADGCFIGSLWKAGQGNAINVVGIIGLLMGIGVVQFIQAILVKPLSVSTSGFTGYLSSLINPLLFLTVLWVIGIILLVVFRRKRYRY